MASLFPFQQDAQAKMINISTSTIRNRKEMELNGPRSSGKRTITAAYLNDMVSQTGFPATFLILTQNPECWLKLPSTTDNVCFQLASCTTISSFGSSLNLAIICSPVDLQNNPLLIIKYDIIIFDCDPNIFSDFLNSLLYKSKLIWYLNSQSEPQCTNQNEFIQISSDYRVTLEESQVEKCKFSRNKLISNVISIKLFFNTVVKAECQICSQLYTIGHECRNCGQKFCKSCFYHWMKFAPEQTPTPCPFCRVYLFKEASLMILPVWGTSHYFGFQILSAEPCKTGNYFIHSSFLNCVRNDLSWVNNLYFLDNKLTYTQVAHLLDPLLRTFNRKTSVCIYNLETQ